MAANKVGRGIFFYLIVLILIILGVALVIGAVMILRPGENTLGMYYYSYTKPVIVSKLNNSPINFSEINTININVEKSKIEFQSNITDQLAYIKYSMFTTGISTSSETSKYLYTNDFKDGVLTINVTEPSGWCFSSKSKIVFNIPETQTLQNTSINIVTTSGSVNVGGEALPEHTGRFVKIKNLDVKTESGSVGFTKYSTNQFDNLSIVTNSGKVYNSSQQNIDASSNADFNNSKPYILVSNDFTLKNSSGDIELQNVKAANFNLTSFKSIINIGHIDSNVNFKSELGNVKIGNVSGTFNATENVKNTNLKIGNINGQFLVADADSARIVANSVRGETRIRVKNGSIDIGELQGQASLQSTTGNIKVVKVSNKNLNILTEKGQITVEYKTSVLAENILTSTAGSNIYVRFPNAAAFKLIIPNVNKAKLSFSPSRTDLDNFISNGNYEEKINGNDVNSLTIKSTGNISLTRFTPIS